MMVTPRGGGHIRRSPDGNTRFGLFAGATALALAGILAGGGHKQAGGTIHDIIVLRWDELPSVLFPLILAISADLRE